MFKNLIEKQNNWYSWDEFCDKCGKQFKHKENFDSSTKPKEKGYCLKCLNKMIDEQVKEEI